MYLQVSYFYDTGAKLIVNMPSDQSCDQSCDKFDFVRPRPGTLHCVSCSKIFLRAGNNPVVLKNSIEHAETLFIALIYQTNFTDPLTKTWSTVMSGSELKVFTDTFILGHRVFCGEIKHEILHIDTSQSCKTLVL